MVRHPYLGINVILENVHDLDLALDRIEQLGCSWVRLTFNWLTPQDKFVDLERYDYFVHGLQKRDINILGTLAPDIPATLKEMYFDHFTFEPGAHMKNYLAFVKLIVGRYRKISYWEVWNEPNTRRFLPNTIGLYKKILLQAKSIIKGYNKKNKVLMGAILGDRFHKQSYYEWGFIEREQIKDDVDIMSIHPYAFSCYVLYDTPKILLQKVISRIAMFKTHYPDKPIWITEFGIADVFRLRMSRKDIAQLYTELLDYCAKNEMPLFLWTLQNFDHPKYFAYNPERFFGLCDAAMNPKETFVEVAKHVREYEKKTIKSKNKK